MQVINLWNVWKTNMYSDTIKVFSLSDYMQHAYPLKGMPRQQYENLKNSGMFWEWYPDATGSYKEDCEEDVQYYE